MPVDRAPAMHDSRTMFNKSNEIVVPRTAPEARLEALELRGLPFAVRRWGRRGAPLLLCLHGSMDCSATWQFMVEAMQDEWEIVAPDLRGHGGSHWPHQTLFFPELVADLAAWVEHLSPRDPVTLIGHSLGGNLAWMYAGARPHRVRKLVLLDAQWAVQKAPDTAPEAYAQWLDHTTAAPQPRHYADHAALAARLRAANPRLTAPRAEFLARHFARPAGTQWSWAADPWILRVMPLQHTLEQMLQFSDRVSAPVLWLGGSESWVAQRIAESPVSLQQRLARFPRLSWQMLEAGHNVHHDQPEQVAALVEEFLLAA
jgi:pimeloyl-ACP methyl ester carboxylesterase